MEAVEHVLAVIGAVWSACAGCSVLVIVAAMVAPLPPGRRRVG